MDEATFRALASIELDRAYRLAGLLLGSAGEAEDATHDAIIRAWQAASTLRDPGRFQPWFDRIVVNVCRDRLRRRRSIRFVRLDAAPELSTPDPFQEVLDGDAALVAMRTLDPDLRTVIVLRFWADLTVDQIAERTGWPTGTVKSRLHRAVASIRTALEVPIEREIGA